jgi:hypothetical protein
MSSRPITDADRDRGRKLGFRAAFAGVTRKNPFSEIS